jgi:YggT family protein
MFVLGNFIWGLAVIVRYLLKILMILVIARAVMTWFNPDPFNISDPNMIVQNVLETATEPFLGPVRVLMPLHHRIGIDMSPAIVVLLAWFIDMFVLKTLEQFAVRLKSK